MAFFWRSCCNPSVAAFASTPSKILRLWIFQERDFIVRATDFPTVTAAVTSASHDSVVNALPLEVPHPPDSKQRKINYSEGRLPPTNTADARWERSASLLALSINFEGDLGDTSMRAIAYA